MIIASAFKRMFSGLTADIVEVDGAKTKAIQFGYGDQKELNAWIVDQNKKVVPSKYPLVWYILNSYTEFQGWYTTDVRLVIMNSSRIDVMNDWRNTNNYTGVLEPVWKVIENTIVTSQFLETFGSLQARFTQFDDPNFGNAPQEQSLKTSNPKGEKATMIDIVDCKVISFKMRINVNCIN